MFDPDYELLKAQALAGYDRNARKASDVSEKTRMIHTVCDSRLTMKLKKINGADDARPSTEEDAEEEEEEITEEAG